MNSIYNAIKMKHENCFYEEVFRMKKTELTWFWGLPYVRTKK